MGGIVNNSPFLDTFHLDTKANAGLIGTIVAVYEIGCFFGALTSAWYAEILGRRRTVVFGSCWLLVGAIVQASTSNIAVLIVGRIVSGFGMGATNSTLPVLQVHQHLPARDDLLTSSG